jgi:hypothetical protein
VERQHLLGERLHRADEISDDLAVVSVHHAPSTLSAGHHGRPTVSMRSDLVEPAHILRALKGEGVGAASSGGRT